MTTHSPNLVVHVVQGLILNTSLLCSIDSLPNQFWAKIKATTKYQLRLKYCPVSLYRLKVWEFGELNVNCANPRWANLLHNLRRRLHHWYLVTLHYVLRTTSLACLCWKPTVSKWNWKWIQSCSMSLRQSALSNSAQQEEPKTWHV